LAGRIYLAGVHQTDPRLEIFQFGFQMQKSKFAWMNRQTF